MNNTKYQSLVKRAFNNELDHYLFQLAVSTADGETINATPEDFTAFAPDSNQIEEYRKACQLGKGTDAYNGREISVIDKLITDWLAENKPWSMFFERFKERALSFPDFLTLYEKKQCHYCKITADEIEQLVKEGKMVTKRLSTRGKAFEVDRVEPNRPYVKDNVVLCCYWCNNAKSDEFTEKEFRPVAEAIRGVWDKRLFVQS